MSVEKMKILDYFMIAHGKECDLRLFSYLKSFSFRGVIATYVGKNDDIRQFYDCTW